MTMMSLGKLNASIQDRLGVTIAINNRLTPSSVGTHRNDLDCANGHMHIAVPKAFLDGLDDVHTGQDLKLLCARCIRLDGDRLDAKRYLVLDDRKRTMNGARVVN